MSLDLVFSIASSAAILGWVVLLLSPLAPRWTDILSGYAIPLALAALYGVLVVMYFGSGDGGFDTLDNVVLLFTQRELVLIGWLHYLAFDLFIGAWEARTARAEGIPFWMVVPCFAFTFLLGPIGLLLFLAIRGARRARAQKALA